MLTLENKSHLRNFQTYRLTTKGKWLFHASTPERDAVYASSLVYRLIRIAIRACTCVWGWEWKLKKHRAVCARIAIPPYFFFIPASTDYASHQSIFVWVANSPKKMGSSFHKRRLTDRHTTPLKHYTQSRILWVWERYYGPLSFSTGMGDQRWNLPVLVQVMPHHIRHGLGVRSTSRPNTGFAHIGRRYTWFVTTVAMMTRAKYCQFSWNLLRTGNNRYYRGQVLICRTRGWLRRSLYFIRNVHQWLLFKTKMYAHTHTKWYKRQSNESIWACIN